MLKNGTDEVFDSAFWRIQWYEGVMVWKGNELVARDYW